MTIEAVHAAPEAPTGRRVLRAVTSVLFYGAVAVAAWFMWPTSLGGCTTLIVVTGHSMEPTYYTGDLVVARCGTPAVGDVVVYRPAEIDAKARIVHRIVGGSGAGGWTLQGDNNDFTDSFAPTDDDVIGIAKLHLPRVALVADVLTSPFIWGGLILLALALAVWPRSEDEDGDDEAGDDEAETDHAETDHAETDQVEGHPGDAVDDGGDRVLVGSASGAAETDEPTASDWDLVAGEPR